MANQRTVASPIRPSWGIVFVMLFILSGCVELDDLRGAEGNDEGKDDHEDTPPTTENPGLDFNLTRSAALTGCTGTSPRIPGPIHLMPWSSPKGFERPTGLDHTAMFLGYHCERVDIFGVMTASNVSFAIEAHSNASDPNGHFHAHEYSGFYAMLAIYTDNQEFAEALGAYNISVAKGTIVAEPKTVRLSLANGGVEASILPIAEEDNPSKLENDFMLLASTDPIVGLKVVETGDARYLGHTSMVASGSSRLAEWQFLRDGAPSTKALLPNTTITIDVVSL